GERRRAAELLPHHQRRTAGGARRSEAAGSTGGSGAGRRAAAEGGQMTPGRKLYGSERWFRLVQRFYPPDFREEMGWAVVGTYMDRARESVESGGRMRLAGVWLRALIDSLRNGAAERALPAASWRRAGNWGRDLELVRRRLARSPAFAATTIG